jgi:hypothetical protein
VSWFQLLRWSRGLDLAVLVDDEGIDAEFSVLWAAEDFVAIREPAGAARCVIDRGVAAEEEFAARIFLVSPSRMMQGSRTSDFASVWPSV